MSRINPVLDVADALSDAQQDQILRRWGAVNQRTPKVADILYLLWMTDSDRDVIDAFWDAHPGTPDHPATPYAVRALIWGRPDGADRAPALTRHALADLLRQVDERLRGAA
jgi:hypothetical protein